MHPFRETTPIRRANRAECQHYSTYLKTLREDFKERCGYCDDSDTLRIRSYTIDHFVPQNPSGFAHTIKSNYYYNLVYACRYCNSAKTNKWPSLDATIHHNGKEGFIDPIEEDYTKLYKRSKTGKITPSDDTNDLAIHIIDELKLWLPIHERMWKLEKINKLNDLVENKINKVEDGELKTQLEQLHYQLLKSWKKIQESIFVENE